MRNDVHFAALKAAAKVAFSVALLNGCSNAVQDGDDAKTDETASSESAVISGDKAPCPETAPTTKPSCDAVLASAFPGKDEYQWEPVAQSAEVVACCDKELTEEGSGSNHRWACCVAYDPASSDANSIPVAWGAGHGMACTPWGPPVPPSMARLAARRAARRAARNAMQAVA